MKNKNGSKVSLLPLFLAVLSIVLIIIVIAMGFIIHEKNEQLAKNNSTENVTVISDKNFSDEKLEQKNNEKEVLANITAKDNTNEENNTVSNIIAENPNVNEYAKKVVENRSYIYDAQYQAENITSDSYATNNGKRYSVSEIKVPYINISSIDANKANSEIEKLYSGFVEEFRTFSQNLNGYVRTEYNTYITSNIYSIVITIERGKEDVITNEFVAYNFDIMSGAKLDYNQVCYIAGINNAAENVKNAIEELKDFDSYKLVVGVNATKEEADKRDAEIDACIMQVYTNYQEDLLNNKLVYFLDNNLKLNISVRLVFPDGKENNKTIIVEA